MTDRSGEEAVNDFKGCGYGEFKKSVGEAVVEHMRPIQERFKEYSSDKSYIEKVTKEGAEKASYLANKTLNKVKKKVGYPMN